MNILSNINGFEWDRGNIRKSHEKHGVTYIECEEMFFNIPILVNIDEPLSITEPRYYVLGKTNRRRMLFLVFTVRKNKIRVISARDISRKEKRIYEEAGKNAEI